MTKPKLKYARFLAKSLLNKRVTYVDWEENEIVKSKVRRTKNIQIITERGDTLLPKNTIRTKNNLKIAIAMLKAKIKKENKEKIWEAIENIVAWANEIED